METSKDKKSGHFSKEEERILNIAQKSYNRAMAYFYYPSLPEPNFEFDYGRHKGFSIDTYNWRVSMNLANTPNLTLKRELRDYFFSLSLHELSHYVYCPYDNNTNFRLLAQAIKGGVNKFHAPMVVNIFTDLIIDIKNHREYPEIMDWELEINANNILGEKGIEGTSPLWQVLVKCYEILWDLCVLPENGIPKKITQTANSICRIVQRTYDDESAWEGKVKRIAKLLRIILKNSCTFDNNAQILPQAGKDKKRGDFGIAPNPLQAPEDVKETFGDISQVKNPHMVKSGGSGGKKSEGPQKDEFIQGTAEQLAPEMNYDTFSDVMTLFGLKNSIQNLAAWYRGIAKNLLEIHMYEKKPGRSLPTYPSTWRLGDPIEELDVMQSILASPVVIPNITTRKWIRKKGFGHFEAKKLPDMMIVVDSSGSMDWNFLKTKVTGRYHVSLLAAFAAMHYAIKHGSYIAGVNFSNQVIKEDWTNKYLRIEKLLLKYQGNGTVLPTKTILQLAKNADQKSLIIIISDLELGNWEPTKEAFQKLMVMGHKIVGFFIDGDPEILGRDDFQELSSQGAKFYCISKMEDLLGLVISELKENYEASI